MDEPEAASDEPADPGLPAGAPDPLDGGAAGGPRASAPTFAGTLRRLALRTRLGSLALVSGGVGLWFAAQLVAGLVLGVGFVIASGGKTEGLQEFVVRCTPLLVLVSTLAALAVVGSLHLLRTLPATPAAASPGRTALWVLGLWLACLGGQAAIGWGQSQAGLEWAEQEMFTQGLKQEGWLLLALAIVILAPLGEELLFRRMAYAALAGPWGRPLAAAATALLFAAVHMNLAGLFLYVWLALCCTVAYERCGRSSAAIAVHGLNNLVAAVSIAAA